MLKNKLQKCGCAAVWLNKLIFILCENQDSNLGHGNSIKYSKKLMQTKSYGNFLVFCCSYGKTLKNQGLMLFTIHPGITWKLKKA